MSIWLSAFRDPADAGIHALSEMPETPRNSKTPANPWLLGQQPSPCRVPPKSPVSPRNSITGGNGGFGTGEDLETGRLLAAAERALADVVATSDEGELVEREPPASLLPDPYTAPLGKCQGCRFIAPLGPRGRCGACVDKAGPGGAP